MTGAPRPPAALRGLVRASLPVEDKDALVAELDQLFRERTARDGRLPAILWYLRQALGFVFRVATARAADALGHFDEYRGDAVVALRYFRRRPAYAAAAVLTLAVGAGALATVYAAAEWVALRPVPGVGDPDELMTIRLGSNEWGAVWTWDISHPDVVTLRERLPLDGRVAAVAVIELDLRPPDGEPRRIGGEMVTANYFDLLRHRLAAGRSFSPSDDEVFAEQPPIVISHSLARTLHPRPLDAVGTDMRINGATFRVIGVAAPGFGGADLTGRADVWVSLAALPFIDPSSEKNAARSRGYGVWSRLIARAPADTRVQIAAAANGIMEAIRREFRAHSFQANHFVMQVFPGIGLDPTLRRSVKRTLSILAAASLFLLALAMANLTNLGLMESIARVNARAVRIALGAGRLRMARSVMVEVLLLASGGVVGALCLASLWIRSFQDARLAERGGILAGMTIDARVIAVTTAAVVLAAVVALFRPLAGYRLSAIEPLLRTARTSTASGQRLRMSLVGVQVAIGLVLLVGARLLTGSIENLRRIELGFNPDRVLVFSLDPHLHGYESEQLDLLARDLERRFTAEPGVAGVGFISPSPLRSSYFTAALYPSADPDAKPLVGAGYYVSPGFLSAAGVRVIAGDRAWQAGRGTVVITRNSINTLFPGTPVNEVVGRTLPMRRMGAMPVRIVAVIDDVRLSRITLVPPPVFFRSLADRPAGVSLSAFLATPVHPPELEPTVRRVMSAHAPELPIFNVRSARAAVDLQFSDVTALAQVAKTLSAIGVVLAAIGLYGVLSNAVATRRREIGIRAALGAAPGSLLARVILSASVPVGLGMTAGLAAAAGSSRLLAQQLFGLSPLEPGPYATAAVVVAVTALAASALPAYHASLISPASVLREE
jgi:predicted permease